MAAANACQGSPVALADHAGYTLREWEDCGAGTVVRWYLTRDGGHAWPGGLPSRAGADAPSAAIRATDVIRDFFARFQLQ